MQINARCEADVTPAQILKRVNEGSGSKYSIHKETYEQERIRPLQSAYKRTEIPDIAAMQRNPTKPEPAPKVKKSASFSFCLAKRHLFLEEKKKWRTNYCVDINYAISSL